MSLYLPEGPWRVVEDIRETKSTGYIRVESLTGQTVCDIFPYARNGIGLEAARAVAQLIVSKGDTPPTTPETNSNE